VKKKKIVKEIKTLLSRITPFEFLLGFVLLTLCLWLVIVTRGKEEWVKAEVKISSDYWWATYDSAPPFWLGESIKVGDKEYNARGQAAVEVLEVKGLERSAEWDEFQQTARKDFYLSLSLRANKNRRTGKLSFKNNPLEVGGPIELHLTNTYVNGLVVSFGHLSKTSEEEVIVDGVWKEAYPWEAEAIPIGGQMKDGIQTVAEILAKETVLAEKTVETDDGRLVVGRDPLARDVYLKIKLKVKKRDGVFYFHEDQKAKVGESIFVQLPGIDMKRIFVRKIFNLENERIY